MKKKRSLAFYSLLHDIEFQIGNECYNGNIQNFGPGGVWEGEGREFRYPMRFVNKEGKTERYRGKLPRTKNSSGDTANCVLGEERYQSAHYAFGANHLHILRGIRLALAEMEKRFNINFDDMLTEEEVRLRAKSRQAGINDVDLS